MHILAVLRFISRTNTTAYLPRQLHPDPPLKNKFRKKMHTRGRRIYQVQRNSDYQSKGMVCHFQQAFQILGELHIIISPRRLRHRRMPISRKRIIGIPLKNLDRRQLQQLQQVPYIYCHPRQYITMAVLYLGAPHAPPPKKQLEVFLHRSI